MCIKPSGSVAQVFKGYINRSALPQDNPLHGQVCDLYYIIYVYIYKHTFIELYVDICVDMYR
jgi:hypothetical protein